MTQQATELIASQVGSAINNQRTWGTIINNVKDPQYGAIGDGIKDDTTYIQAAINAAQAVGGIVYFPAGTYLISSALTITGNNIMLVGVGKASRIITKNATADIFAVGDGVNPILNILFRDLCMDTTVTKTAGWAINFRFGARCKVEGCWFLAPEDTVGIPKLLNGIYFDRFDYCRVESCYLNISGTGIQARGNANQSYGAGLFLGGGTKIYGAAVGGAANSKGIYIGGGAGGVVFGDLDVIDCVNCVVLDDGLQPGSNNRELFFTSGCSLDSAGFANLNIGTNGGVHIDLTGTWVASSGSVNPDGAGITIGTGQATGMHIKMSGVRFFNNRGGGFQVNGGSFQLEGCLFKSNGLGTNGGHAVHVANAGVTDFNITGNEIISNGTATKGWGILIGSGSNNNYVVTSNNIRNNAQGQISDLGGTNKVVANNLTT